MIRALVALARPRLLPFVLALPLAGYGWAHWDRALTARGGEALVAVLLAWTALHAGTLWLNAALDRDTGEVLLGEPVPPPRGVDRLGLVALAVAVLAAVPAGAVVAGATALAAGLAVAYSHPRLAWKGHPVLGPVVNVVGYGLLSPLVGWVVVDVAPNARTLAAWGVGAAGVLGAYFLAQAFQGPEDRARGYRTLVAVRGPRATLAAARACFGGAWTLLGALVLAGWLPRLLGLALPLALVVDRRLVRWAARPDGGGAADAVATARRLGWAGLAVLALALADYVHGSLAGAPVAGLGTVAGHPADRERLSPWAARLAARPGAATPPTRGAPAGYVAGPPEEPCAPGSSPSSCSSAAGAVTP